jgi:hypothetical protein
MDKSTIKFSKCVALICIILLQKNVQPSQKKYFFTARPFSVSSQKLRAAFLIINHHHGCRLGQAPSTVLESITGLSRRAIRDPVF